MSIKPQPLAELIRGELRYRTIENLVANASNPEAMKRRMFDILSGKSATVTLRVADEIAITCGHPEWLQLV